MPLATQPRRDGTLTNLSLVPGAAIPTPSRVRQAPTTQQQVHMAAAAVRLKPLHACMHARSSSSSNMQACCINHSCSHPCNCSCERAAGCGLWRCHLCNTQTSGKSPPMGMRRLEVHESCRSTREKAHVEKCGIFFRRLGAMETAPGPP
eukprot:366103-Chlamydomonas_euryale.AAC.5